MVSRCSAVYSSQWGSYIPTNPTQCTSVPTGGNCEGSYIDGCSQGTSSCVCRQAQSCCTTALGAAGQNCDVSASWKVGSIDSRTFYRTNFANQEGLTGSAKHVPYGLYDPVSNQTFLVYTGGVRSDGIHSAQDPYITSFNHSSKIWSNPIRLAQIEPLGGLSDDHNYPQVTLDNQGYIHVLYTGHAGPMNIIQTTSNVPRNIGSSVSDWGLSNIPNTCNSTYGAAFTDNQGEIYMFHRASIGIVDYRWYEPEVYVKSTDSGKTWTEQITAIDPGRHIDLPECAKNPDGSYIHTCSDRSCGTTAVTHNLPTGTPGPTSIYTGHVFQDKVRNGVWLQFYPFTGHGIIGGWPNPSGLKHVVFFSFDNDHFYSIDGTDYGPTIDSTEFTACCKISDDNKGDRNHFFVMEDQTNRYPTIYYGRDVSGITTVFKANWNSTSKTWTHTDLSSVFGSINSIATVDYTPQTGTDIYVKSATGGLAPFTACNPAVDPALNYQYPLMLYNNRSGTWKSLRLFNDVETDSLGVTADHRSWEVQKAHRVATIPNSHPEMRTFINIPKTSCTKPLAGDPPGAFSPIFPLGTYYVLGEKDLSSPPGDLNGDGKVDSTDMTQLTSDFGKAGTPGFTPADIDANGFVNIFDYNTLVANFGK